MINILLTTNLPRETWVHFLFTCCFLPGRRVQRTLLRHKIIGLEGTLKIVVTQSLCHGQFGQLGEVFKGLSSLAFNTAELGVLTTSLGNLFPCLSALTVKNFFQYLYQISPLSVCTRYSMFHHYSSCLRVPFQVPCGPLSNTARLL